MAAISGLLPRKLFVTVLVLVGCTVLLLLGSRMVAAQQMVASWYGSDFEGNTTANGETFDPSGYTAASKTLDFDTKLIVTYEGRSVVVRINDRGPYIEGRDLDLSQGAAEYIGLTSVGVATVDVAVADPSTPEGPYSPPRTVSREATGGGGADAGPGRQAERPAADAQEPASRQERLRDEFAALGAEEGQDQYATEDQYASEDQYFEVGSRVIEEVAPPPPPPAPQPPVPVLPPAPEPEALQSPPPELVVENSTVKRRVELELAAPPAPQPETVEEVSEVEAASEVEEAPEVPEVEEEEAVQKLAAPERPEPVVKADDEKEGKEKKGEEVMGLTMLPDTGGASVASLVAGMFLISLGAAVLRFRR